jgi:hypothetical protein
MSSDPVRWGEEAKSGTDAGTTTPSFFFSNRFQRQRLISRPMGKSIDMFLICQTWDKNLDMMVLSSVKMCDAPERMWMRVWEKLEKAV